MAIATVNPATGETIKTFDSLSVEELDAKLARAAEAFQSYRLTTFAERAGWMRAAADILDREADSIAATMTTEMGKTLKSAKAEAQKCAKACRFYADHAEEFLRDEPADPAAVNASRAFTRYLPIGPVLAVMPWNFPLWQAMRFAAPALMAGNVGLLKHASNVPQTALFLEDVFSRAGFPDGVFQTLLIGSDLVERVLRDRRVMAATLTGSTPAGQAVARVAGEEIKKTVLELGGSDPFVVLPSADLDKAAEVAVVARCQNNGQSCIAAKRFIVHEAVADEFERRFVERMAALRLGDPMDDATDLGPLATEQGRADVEELVADAVEAGRHRPPRRSAARRAGLVLSGHRHHRHHPPDAALLRRGLRTRGLALPGVQRRRGPGTGQRHRLRPRIQRLDHRPGGAGALRAGHGGRSRVRERDDDLVPRPALRWREDLGLRPGALGPRDPGVLQYQGYLDQLIRSGLRTR